MLWRLWIASEDLQASEALEALEAVEALEALDGFGDFRGFRGSGGFGDSGSFGVQISQQRLLLAALPLTKKCVRLNNLHSSCVFLLELNSATSAIVPYNSRHYASHATPK